MIKKFCSVVGLDASLFSAHSLRKGGATVALLAGVDDTMVKAQGDWVSDAYQRYITFSMAQRESVPRKIAEAMRKEDFNDRCTSLALATQAALY